MALFSSAIHSVVPGSRAKEHAALVTEHARDERETETRALQLQRDIARDDERCAQLRASVDEATAHRYKLQLELSQLSNTHDRRRSERERTLRELADPRIEALREARARTEALKFQTVPDLAAALEDIRHSVPTVDRAEDLIRDPEVA